LHWYLNSASMSPMELNTKKIEREITVAGFTSKTFADAIGITRQGLWYILERKTTTLERLNLIANALDMDPKDILT